jgi:DMSO/TMAO reductase YedYZ molybdopterin-dependent catalytic subunit
MHIRRATFLTIVLPLLAYDMNFKPLTIPHGAPLRLRAENELGFKMVKWI